MLNQAQINQRVASRLTEIEEDQFKMIGALQRLGADLCDVCDEWQKDCWTEGDDCICKDCMEFNQGRPLENEDLDEEAYNRKGASIARYLTSRGMKVRNAHVLDAYKTISR